MQPKMLRKYICHSKKVLDVGKKYNWLNGAQYKNLRNIKRENYLGFLDIDWKNYSFSLHLDAAREHRPLVTVARDIEDINDLKEILLQAENLRKFSRDVIIVPKDPSIGPKINSLIPQHFIIGYSVPTKYGNTSIPIHHFKDRPVHLLGGRPDIQRKIGEYLNVVSIDTNRHTIDAAYGKYFDGQKFKMHPVGGYTNCLASSFKNINFIWKNYLTPERCRKMEA